ncbi:MAG TPA: hypothetical protein VMV78_10560 [Thiobacillus sp.]|nr:hypothetical protein [Thiobacillus sp.]
MFDGAVRQEDQVTHWYLTKDGDLNALALFHRHYSHRKYGEKLVLVTAKYDALFVWRKFIDASGQQGVNCSVFRNESAMRSSELIRDAMEFAFIRWPDERLYTYVNPNRIRSTNPGCCFRKAGWQICGKTKGGLIVLDFQKEQSHARLWRKPRHRHFRLHAGRVG